MSHFYGYLRGSRGTTTRCGGKDSGINAHLKSWNNDVFASLEEGLKGKDLLNLRIPVGLRVMLNNKCYKMTDKGLRRGKQ